MNLLNTYRVIKKHGGSIERTHESTEDASVGAHTRHARTHPPALTFSARVAGFPSLRNLSRTQRAIGNVMSAKDKFQDREKR